MIKVGTSLWEYVTSWWRGFSMMEMFQHDGNVSAWRRSKISDDKAAKRWNRVCHMESRQVFEIFNLKNFEETLVSGQTNFSHLWKCAARPTTATTNGWSAKRWFRRTRSVFSSSSTSLGFLFLYLGWLASTFGCWIIVLISYIFIQSKSLSDFSLNYGFIDIRILSLILKVQ